MNLVAERIESLKAGGLGAIATTIGFSLLALIPIQPIRVAFAGGAGGDRAGDGLSVWRDLSLHRPARR